MMKKQRVGAIVLAGMMMLSMTGCGNSKAKAYSKYVTLGDYKGIEYTKTVAAVTEDDIQSKLDSFVDGLAETNEVTDRAVEDGDIVNIDYVGTMDGEEFDGGSATGQDLTIGSNSFIDGFETGLIGHNVGDEVSLDLQFPDPYPNNTDLAGKDVNFKVTINKISVKTTPELTDQLVKDNTDYDTIDAYKESIKEDLKKTNETNAEKQAKSDIFDKVVSNCKISGYDEDVVKDLVDEEFKSFKNTADSYKSYGYSYEDVLSMNGYDSEDSLKKGITEYVKKYLDQKMVLYCIAAKEGIKVSSEETDKKVQEYMDTYNVKTKEEVYNYFGDDYFEVLVLSEKVMDYLKDNAKLVDSTEADSEDTEAADGKDTTEATTTEASSESEDTTEDTESTTEDTEATTAEDTEATTTEAE
ncbi:MAG TPA: trigger factor [Lachnospiraceae bacterium]|nr:trigger factor [Lachnospiraceae bacterium]